MPHLVWDWNGTLLDDLAVVVAATNASLATVGGPAITADEHRRDYRRPIADYYAHLLGRPVSEAEFRALDDVFHLSYRTGLSSCRLAVDALDAIAAWTGTQSLLSMYFHDELVTAVTRHGLASYLCRVDGLRARVGGGPKAPHLRAHLDALAVDPADCVLIGDSIDDAEAASAVGARVVLYEGGFTHPERLRATGLPVARTLLEAVAHASAHYSADHEPQVMISAREALSPHDRRDLEASQS
ncbi:MAG TPA: HAD hydrolase-like protein [Micromonosporaceae bacterium]|nr:HAD hydrolase-like protein [Micromonosporaceae bacterium]